VKISYGPGFEEVSLTPYSYSHCPLLDKHSPGIPGHNIDMQIGPLSLMIPALHSFPHSIEEESESSL
jgi:hypothetical protein